MNPRVITPLLVSLLLIATACTEPASNSGNTDNTNENNANAGNQGNNGANNANNAPNNTNNTNNTNNGAENNAVACLDDCGEGCPAPEFWPCGSDGKTYCNTCEIECMGLEVVDDEICNPTGSGDDTLGRACETTETCAPGLQCLDVLIGDDCQSAGMACSAFCQTDEECAEHAEPGTEARCVENCDGSSDCVQVASSDLGPGSVCQMDGQCQMGLSCLTLASGGVGNCQPVSDTCTIECTSDADCEAFAPNFKCFSQCDDKMLCGLIGE